jgi:hypothetical protein
METNLLLLSRAAVEIDQIVVTGNDKSGKDSGKELCPSSGIIVVPIIAPAKVMLKPGLDQARNVARMPAKR